MTLPDFSLSVHNGSTISNRDLAGKWTVLYFYPRDNTPGCTTEAIEFSQALEQFQALNCTIYGISPDTLDSHCKFVAKKELRVRLISDTEHQFTELCGFWQLKKFMGKEFMGVIRSTLLINPKGEIAYSWSPVKLKNHVNEVLAKLQELS